MEEKEIGLKLSADTEIVEAEEIIDENSAVRRYCLTENNPERTDEEMFEYLNSFVPDIIKYAIFQREKGEEKETEHFQMFIVLASPMRFKRFKSMFPRAHIEKARGSNVEARNYCKKEDTRVSGYYELGTFSEERGRTDIKNFYDAIDSGMGNVELRKLFPNLYSRMLGKIDQIRQETLSATYSDKLKENFVVVYIYGESGVGKTYNLFTHFGNKAYRVTDYDKNPFDNYRNEDVIIFDEFRSQIDFSMFLKLIDVYPINLSRRYANAFGNYTKVFITTNQPAGSQYTYQRMNDMVSWQGYNRRIHFVLNFESREKIVVEKASLPLEKLQEVLPPNMWNICDFKYITQSIVPREQQVQFFEVTPDDDLPF